MRQPVWDSQGQGMPLEGPAPWSTVSSLYMSDLQLQRPLRSRDATAMASPSPACSQRWLPPVASSGPHQPEEGKCPALAQGR